MPWLSSLQWRVLISVSHFAPRSFLYFLPLTFTLKEAHKRNGAKQTNRQTNKHTMVFFVFHVFCAPDRSLTSSTYSQQQRRKDPSKIGCKCEAVREEDNGNGRASESVMKSCSLTTFPPIDHCNGRSVGPRRGHKPKLSTKKCLSAR